VLRLWRSNIHFTDSNQPLWVGTINYLMATSGQSFYRHTVLPDQIQGATKELSPYLKKFQWKLVHYPIKHPNKRYATLPWDGDLLLIRPAVPQEKSSKKLVDLNLKKKKS